MLFPRRNKSKYKVHPIVPGQNLYPIIEITDGGYKGTRFSFSPRINIEEIDGEARVKFIFFLEEGSKHLLDQEGNFPPDLRVEIIRIGQELFEQEQNDLGE